MIQRGVLRGVRYLGMLLLLALCRTGFSQDTGASLLGVVRDSAGSTVSGATVAATNAETNARTVETSNQKGEYSLLNLAPGTYSLSVKAAGFQGYDQAGIRLDLGQHASLDVALRVGQVQQTVTVNADVTDLDTVSSQVSDEVNGTSIRSLPTSTTSPA